jgi:hypothetical protein
LSILRERIQLNRVWRKTNNTAFPLVLMALIAATSLPIATVAAESPAPEMTLDSAQNSIVRILPLRQFTFRKDLHGDAGTASIAFDEDRVYISSPDGLVMAGDSLRSSFRKVFRSQNHGISQIYVKNHTLYVLTGLHQAESDVHAMFSRGIVAPVLQLSMMGCVFARSKDALT